MDDYNSNKENNSWDTFRSYRSAAPETASSNVWHNEARDTNANAEYRFSYQDVNAQAASNDTRPQQGKKKGGFLRAVACVLAIALLSAVCGAGGSLIANKYLAGSGAPAASQQTVINQVAPNSAAPASSGSGSSISQLVAATQNSVVEITTETASYGMMMGQYVTEGAGSGVIISADGYIVTCNHVISDASKITVKTSDGASYDATLVGADSKTDIAVIKIDASGLAAATLGSSNDLAVGDFVIAIGNPLGELGGTVTNGIISALSRDVTISGETMTLLQTNAAVNPGNSGGALFDENGMLIGIVNAKSSGSDVEGIGFAIPIDLVSEVVTDLIDKGYVGGRFSLGVNIIEIADEHTAQMYRVERTGVYVQAVQNNSNAQLAGVQAGDCILTFNGVSIATNSDLTDALAECTAEQQVEMTILRSGKEYSLMVQLRESRG